NRLASLTPTIGHNLLSTSDLTIFLTMQYPNGEAIISHNYWAVRSGGPGSPPVFPFAQAQFAGTVANKVGWPRKTSDRSASLVPFLSDQCYSGYGTTASTNINSINIVGGTRKKYSGHVNNGVLYSVNHAYADGHVISNRREQIRAQYSGDSGQAIWFY